MAEKSILFEVVTPEKKICSQDVDSLVVPATQGYLGILPDHAPLITSLDIGVVKFTKDGKPKKMAVSGGFLEVKDNKVIILADTAELGDQIDLARAEDAKERARRRMEEHAANLDVLRAELALKRAISRINAAQK
ncbi:F0F1 ATP synthase subunit epsilon [Dehalobacterium formicoaceticum]|uniref:ATP synthase epsilon chain n=1 Tax=Dehalobacterium formicoaceticum TaxID=51515 RepID=A0ABT1Y3H4_9FIRM|nr:F0F1 ATP synthase subunit epsilon [Dehalobacterium formicoaceticum]MCR6545422.1 F0F1 ATP synthase subunit epsilon [Dehalobacterium formicoaceticum]